MNAPTPDLTRRLRLMGNQMMAIASEIAQTRAEPALRTVFEGLTRDSDALLIVAEDMLMERRARQRHFPNSIFGEPSWDILLDLYVAEKRRKRISVTSACLAAMAPETTALRHLQGLERSGLVERCQDETDARRRFVRLTDAGYAQMTTYLASTRADLLERLGSPDGSHGRVHP